MKRIVHLTMILTLIVILSSSLPSAKAISGTIYESESNNTLATANQTYNDYNNYGAISTNNDVDYWKVSFSIEGMTNFWMGSVPNGCQYRLCVYANNGATLIGWTYSDNYGMAHLRCHTSANQYLN